MWSLGDWLKRRTLARHPVDPELWERVRQRLPMLDGISDEEDRYLRDSCVLFLRAKHLTALEGVELDDESRLFLAAQAQLPLLALGDLNWYQGFHEIILYGDDFISPQRHRDASGIEHEWDGEHRIDTWLSEYLGAEESAYIRSAGKKWLIGAVARAMESPVKMDCVLILEGSQGAGKSTALRILGGQWFSDAAFQIGDKDGYQQMLGVWIMELAELDSFNKAESTRAKSFFATDSDRYRPPYGKRVVEYPRQCVFAGSTNQDSYFKDSTGNRRYWPVKCGEINLKALARDRDQLFAEALIGYKTGDSWHVTENEKQLFEREQGDRFLDDAWEALVVAYLDAPERITRQQIELAEIFTGALNMEPMTWRPPEQTRLAQILQRLGWKKVRPFCPVEKKRVYKYQRPDAGQVPGGSNE